MLWKIFSYFYCHFINREIPNNFWVKSFDLSIRGYAVLIDSFEPLKIWIFESDTSEILNEFFQETK